uniref:Uncharacterized protein n=1 Tax=Trypanosoma congolense (strain IL3000) TaxID=1068625 RepID=G0UXZ1_TRYCI|nr:conserved hypothetical protein [Trypanosoma congolense IL3000]
MRDVLGSFIQASAARGAWSAALAAWNASTAANRNALSPSHTLLLARLLAQCNCWYEAVAVATGGEVKMCARSLAARRVALAATAKASCWKEACIQMKDIQRLLKVGEGLTANTVSSFGAEEEQELRLILNLFAERIIPMVPHQQRGAWDSVVSQLRHEVETRQSEQPISRNRYRQHSTNGGAATGFSHEARCSIENDVVTNNDELLYILRGPKERNSWSLALQLLLSMSDPNAASVNIVVGILRQQGRQSEILHVVNDFMALRKIRPTTVTVKVLAEAANAMRSMPLCTSILSNSLLREQLTPQAAVPLVLALHKLGGWKRCLAWWDSLPQPNPVTTEKCDVGFTNSNVRTAANLRHHLKLSNYVAVCLAGAGHWLEALAALRDAAPYDPPLAVLFSLRALRVAKRWEAALRLLGASRPIWKESKVTVQVLDLFAAQNVESWIPPTVMKNISVSLNA